MKQKISLLALLLLSAMLLTGCVQIYLPNKGETGTGTEETRESVELTDEPKEVFRESGILASEQVNGITLLAAWEAYSYDGKTATVSVSVRLTCESIRIAKQTGRITVNGESLTFSTKPFDYSGENTTTFKLVNNKLFQIDLEDCDYELKIRVEWPSGTEVSRKLTAQGSMLLPGAELDSTGTKDPADTDDRPATGETGEVGESGEPDTLELNPARPRASETEPTVPKP